jgi:hypothetical protein
LTGTSSFVGGRDEQWHPGVAAVPLDPDEESLGGFYEILHRDRNST